MIMRVFLGCFAIVAAMDSAAARSAVSDPSSSSAAVTVDNALFEALAAAETPAAAEAVAGEIIRRWRMTPSATVSLLFSQADHLRAVGDDVGARAKLSGIVQLMPGLAEGWAARGTVQWALGEHDAALSDLEAALEAEPRHFQALVLMGEILEAEDEAASALRAYRRAASVHPFLPGVADKIRALAVQETGTDD